MGKEGRRRHGRRRSPRPRWCERKRDRARHATVHPRSRDQLGGEAIERRLSWRLASAGMRTGLLVVEGVSWKPATDALVATQPRLPAPLTTPATADRGRSVRRRLWRD